MASKAVQPKKESPEEIEMLLATIDELNQKLENSEKANISGTTQTIVTIDGKEYVSKFAAFRYQDKIVKIEDHTPEQLKKLLELGSIFEQ